MTPVSTDVVAYPDGWQTRVLEQIEDVQREQVLDDDVILQLPWLVIACDNEQVEVVSRHATNADAVKHAADLAIASDAWDEIFATSLEAVGYGKAATVTQLPPGRTTDAEGQPDAGTDEDEPEHVDDSGQTALIDRSQYDREDLAIPKIDGQSVDRIAINFSGQVFLERSNPEHVALYNALVFGGAQIPALRVEGRCSGTAGKMATDKGGSLDVVVGSKTYKVESVSIPAGEA